MKHYAGLDVSLRETSICVVDEKRRVIREGCVSTETEAIADWLRKQELTFEMIGLEASSLAPALYSGLSDLGFGYL